MSDINARQPDRDSLRMKSEQIMFANSVKLFSIYGFDIKVDPSWLIIASLVTWSLSQQYFPFVLPDQSQQTYWTMAAFGMLGLFASLLLHELAHSVVARHLGVRVKSITLFIFGGLAELGSEPTSARTEFQIALVGPVMSLGLALGCWTFAQAVWLLFGAAALAEVLSYLAFINLVLALFNLVPAFPLDGGRVLRAYLWHRSGDPLGATQTAAQFGKVFAYFLMALGVFALFRGAFVAGLWQLMIGGFLLIAARSSYTSQLVRSVFEGKTVSALMTRDPVTVGPDVTLSALVSQIMLRQGLSFVPVVEEGILLGHMDQSVLSGIDRGNWGNTRVGDVFVGLADDVLIAPDLPVPELLDIIARTGRRKFMVVLDRKLLGVVTLADLSRYLTRDDIAVKPKPRTQNSHS